jgi:uncharacterized protein (DUF1697 family)
MDEDGALRLERVLRSTAGIRRGGSAALDLCYVAQGTFDAFWELHLNPWDVAAGVAILEEAGGRATRLDGGPLDLETGSVLAAAPRSRVGGIAVDPEIRGEACRTGAPARFLQGARKIAGADLHARRVHEPSQAGAEAGGARAVADEIVRRRGFKPHVLVLERSEFERAIDNNPFPEGESNTLHLGFLDSVPSCPDLHGLEALRAPSERFELIGQVFYLFAPDGVGRSKLAAKSEKALGVPMTDRNWRTVTRIMSLLEAQAE